MSGRYNLVAGVLFTAAFMIYGFVLIYLRDFAPDREAWIASYSLGSTLKHGWLTFTATSLGC